MHTSINVCSSLSVHIQYAYAYVYQCLFVLVCPYPVCICICLSMSVWPCLSISSMHMHMSINVCLTLSIRVLYAYAYVYQCLFDLVYPCPVCIDLYISISLLLSVNSYLCDCLFRNMRKRNLTWLIYCNDANISSIANAISDVIVLPSRISLWLCILNLLFDLCAE